MHFGTPRNDVFQAMLDLWAEYGVAGAKPTLIAARLQGAVSADEIGSYALRLGEQEDVLLYARQVYDVAKRRELRQVCMNLYVGAATMSYDELVELAQRRIFRPITPGETKDEQSLGELATTYFDDIEELKEPARTGVKGLDKAIGGGFQPGKVVVLLGPPGAGKTTLANQMAEHIASVGRPVYYVTSEDAPFALLCKTVARMGNLDYTDVLQGKAPRAKVEDAFHAFLDSPSAERLVYKYIVGSFTLEQVQERAGEHFHRFTEAENGGPGVLVIDYLQRLARFERTVQGLDTREMVTRFTMQLREVAESLNCTLMALCSMNRQSYNTTKAITLEQILSAAKESGDIEFTCDILLGLVEDVENRVRAPGHLPCKLHVAKNRLGLGGQTLDLDFNRPFQVFAGAENK